MSETNILPFSRPSRNEQKPDIKAQHQRISAEHDKILEKRQLFVKRARVEPEDRLRLATNLGDIIADYCRSKGQLDTNYFKKSLKELGVEKSLGDDNFRNRKRFILFRDEITTSINLNKLSASGANFINLLDGISQNIHKNMPKEEFERQKLENSRKLFIGTEFDIDPLRNAQVDFDSLNELKEVIAALDSVIEKRLPKLDDYFRKCVDYGIQYLVNTESNDYLDFIRFATENPINNLPQNDSGQKWMELANKTYTTVASNRVHTKPYIGDNPAILGHKPFLKGSFEEEGFIAPEPEIDCLRFSCEENCAELHYPKVFLGSVNLKKWLPKLFVDELDSSSNINPNFDKKKANEFVLLLEKDEIPKDFDEDEVTTQHIVFDIYLAIMWQGAIGSEKKHLALIAKPNHKNEINAPAINDPLYHDENGSLVRLEISKFTIESELSSGNSLNDEPISIDLFKKTGSAILGKVASRYESQFKEITSWKSLEIYFESGFSIPPTFAPQAQNTIAGQMVRNILYAEGGENIIEKLIEDAQLRIDWVEKHYRKWVSDYKKSKSEIAKKFEKSVKKGK